MSAETVIKQIKDLSPDEKWQVRQFILDEQSGKNGTEQPRKPNLHPDAMEMASDFDAPLPNEFWTGKE